MTKQYAYAAGIAYIGSVVLANYVTNNYGMVPVGFGQVATAGTYVIGAAFILRDVTQRLGGRHLAIASVALASVVSWFVASPALALASATAFALSEAADMSIYTPLQKRGFFRAVVASNIVGSVLDSLIFLSIAGFPVAVALPGQLIGKLVVTAAFVLPAYLIRNQVEQATA